MAADAETAGEQAAPGRTDTNGGARHQSAETAAGAVPAAPRAGAHAAPYMDATGALHNLKPIGRLTLSGPDPEPRRGDTEFGSLWFSAKESSADPAADELPTRTRVRRAADDHVVIDLDVTGLFGGITLPAGEVSAEPEPPHDGGPRPEQPRDPRWQSPEPAAHAPEPAAHQPERAAHEPESAAHEPDPAAQKPDPAAGKPEWPATAAAAGAGRAESGAGPSTAEPQATEAQPPATSGQTGPSTTTPEQPAAGHHQPGADNYNFRPNAADAPRTAVQPEYPAVVTQPASAAARLVQPATSPSADPTRRATGTTRPEPATSAEPALALLPGPQPVLEKEPPKRSTAERRELTAADLQAIRWRLDGGTLREVVDDTDALRELGEKLDEPLADETDNVAKAGFLSVRAEVYRLLGELGMAAAASRLALAHAESAQDLQSMVIAQAELAHVLRLRGDFAEADRLFGRAAHASVPAPLRSVVHENAGRCCFDQGRYMEALDHFARAVRLGRPDDTDLAERIGVCLEAVYIHVLRDGWGPYPRRSLDAMDGSGSGRPAGNAPGAFGETTAEQRMVRPR